MEKGGKRYSLSTAVAMIVGICIGSGIFFKTDNILFATGGSVLKGILAFVLGAVSIIFGGLSFGELARRSDCTGGIIGYCEKFSGGRAACATGWFMTFVYFPVLMVVVARVIGIYTCMLFGIRSNVFTEGAIGLAFIIICFGYNLFFPKFGGLFQNISTAVKLLPLVIFALAGFIFGDPSALTASTQTQVSSAGWLTAIAPIAFSYDGWIVSTSISHELKNGEKNLPRALIIGPFVVLTVYIAYFTGVSMLLGADKIIAMGDSHVYAIAESIFGGIGAKAILIFVIISVMGAVNGLILGFIRMPYSLALRENSMPFAKSVARLDKNSMPLNSAAVAFLLTMFWLSVHVLVSHFGILKNSDISEVSVAMSYVFYIPLYYNVYKLYKRGEIKSAVKGIFCPLLATLGSLMIFGGAMGNLRLIPMAAMFALPSLAGAAYYKYSSKRNAD